LIARRGSPISPLREILEEGAWLAAQEVAQESSRGKHDLRDGFQLTEVSEKVEESVVGQEGKEAPFGINPESHCPDRAYPSSELGAIQGKELAPESEQCAGDDHPIEVLAE